jgi:hypothetical protein
MNYGLAVIEKVGNSRMYCGLPKDTAKDGNDVTEMTMIQATMAISLRRKWTKAT